MTEAGEGADDWPPDVPRWDDDYLNRVALRLSRYYDLERDYAVDGERFVMYGRLQVRHERHVMHPSVTFAKHEAHEHVFVTRIPTPTVADLKRFEALGERLADEWVKPDENHYSTDFTFVVIASSLPGAVVDFVDGYRNRNLLRFGFHGHTEVNLVAVQPEQESSVASASADVEQAFRVWEPIVTEEPGRLSRLLSWLSR